jgi:hypothetical protein
MIAALILMCFDDDFAEVDDKVPGAGCYDEGRDADTH